VYPVERVKLRKRILWLSVSFAHTWLLSLFVSAHWCRDRSEYFWISQVHPCGHLISHTSPISIICPIYRSWIQRNLNQRFLYCDRIF